MTVFLTAPEVSAKVEDVWQWMSSSDRVLIQEAVYRGQRKKLRAEAAAIQAQRKAARASATSLRNEHKAMLHGKKVAE